MTTENAILKELKNIVGKKNVSGDIYERISFGQDSAQPDLDPANIPIAVVKPQNTEAVAEFIKFANKNKIPVYIHGAGTAFKGSPKPKRPGSILLSMHELTSIESHEEDMYYELGAGVNLYQLEKLLLSRGYLLPMCIGSKFASTIGGAVSINTIGHMVDACVGKLIDYVMGVEVVLPNGEIIDTGTRSIRRPAGLDLTRNFVGGEGLFGVITKIRLRVLPDPKKGYVVGFFPELTDIAHGFQKYYWDKNPPPLYGELLDKVAAEAPFELRGLGKPKGHMALAITVSHSQSEADAMAQKMVQIFKEENAVEAYIVEDEQKRKDLWDARDNILNILQASDGGDRLVMAGAVEASVPLSHLDDVLVHLESGHSYQALKEAMTFIYGHIGTCDLHGMWVAPVSMAPEKRMEIAKAATKLESDINTMWGCASGEVGQTASRIPFFKRRYGPAAHAMLMAVKRAVDPNNILNPGNLEGEGYE
ncbi:MAG: FAD-binding oxidoreductase [Desulfobacterales bacterium]|nr:FAD-binding oxidoreductase [Desulfobacterales bacterium]